MLQGLRRHPAVGIALAVTVASLAYDRTAAGASPKRALGLLLGVVLLAYQVATTRRGNPTAPDLPLPVGLFFAFVAWSGVTLAFGIPSGAADLATLMAALAIMLAAHPLGTPAVQEAAHWAGLLTGGGAAAFALVEWFGGARGIFVHGAQGNANWLGLLLAVATPLSLGWIAGRRTRWEGGVGWVVIALEVVGIGLSHSRVAWVACAIMNLGVFVLLLRSCTRARTIFGGLLVAALVVGAVLMLRPRTPAGPPTSGADVPVPVAFEGRVTIWRTSLLAAERSLPLGAGLGRFTHAYLDAQGERLKDLPAKVASRRFINATTAHSDWLQPLVESGPIGLLLLALAVTAATVAAARTRWWPGVAALASFATTAAGDSPLRQPAVALLLALVFAAAPRADARLRPPPIAPRVATLLVRAPLLPVARWSVLAASALLLASSCRIWLGERMLADARTRTPTEQRNLLIAAARVDPGSGEIALERGLRELDLGHVASALRELTRSRRLLGNVGTEVAIGNAEMLLEDPVAAVAAYRRALAQNPGAFRAHANLSQALLVLGDLDEASRHLAIAKELWPGHPRLADMTEELEKARIDRATDGP